MTHSSAEPWPRDDQEEEASSLVKSKIPIIPDGDYYEILGVDKKASTKTIRRAFRDLAKLYHPDVVGFDDGTFTRLSLAYATLVDKNRRYIYDNDPTADTIETSRIWGSAKALLHELLSQMLENEYNLAETKSIEKMVQIFRQIKEKHKATRAELNRILDSLNGLLASMRVKEGTRPTNLLAQVISEQKFPLEEAWEECDREVKALGLLIRELKNIDQILELSTPFDTFSERGKEERTHEHFKPAIQWHTLFDKKPRPFSEGRGEPEEPDPDNDEQD